MTLPVQQITSDQQVQRKNNHLLSTITEKDQTMTVIVSQIVSLVFNCLMLQILNHYD